MGISIKDVQVGKFFVHSYAVREIARIKGDDVVYYTYLLDTGESTHSTSSMCSKREITRWSDRLATSEEVARMKITDARKSEEAYAVDVGKRVLQGVPDDWLIEEIKRRGLTVESTDRS
jgi:hypothetical protein